MERSRWDRIQEIYHSALSKPRSERSAFIARACDQDAVLIQRVKELLDIDDSSGNFLASPVFEKGLRIISSTDDADASTADNLVGTTIAERYLIDRKLGRGGIAAIYRALDQKLHNRAVVIKILLQASRQNPYVVKKFKHEAEALARIHHDGVVGVLGTGELADGTPYIVMEYVSGQMLRSQIPSDGMNLKRAATIIKQIGAALDEVHEKGIFHCDLKPENIMLQVRPDTESVKIVDFGIAKVKDSVIGPSTTHAAPVGTVLYMSPEQLRGESITAASDVYSMAVIAYEMITGRRPFNPTSPLQLLEMHRAGVRVKPIHLRPNISTKTQAIILRGLSFDAAARYQSAREFGDDLARSLLNDRKRPGLERFPIWQRKKQLAAFGGSFIILLSLVLLSLATYKACITKPKPGTRSLTYWLTVQKMRAGEIYQDPFQSFGEETFERGDKFRLNVSVPEAGYLYVFNEGPPEPDATSFKMLYPATAVNNGSATVGANQTVQSDWITFRGLPGAENFWIVWSVSLVTKLEAAKAEAFSHAQGGLTEQNLVAIKEFLQVKQAELDARTYRRKSSQQATVYGKSDMLVKLVEFKHR